MKTLKELKTRLLADGVIDAAEAKELKEVIYADGIIDKEEADFLFELNDAVSGKNNAPEWTELFVQAISDFLLKDANTPGEVDAAEAAWLAGKIGNDGKVDATEKALLQNLQKQAKAFPENLKALL